MTQSEQQSRGGSTRSAWVPLALFALTFFLMVGFQTTQLMREREMLRTIRTNQDAPLREAQRIRAQLDSIAAQTARLANEGNDNAKTIIDRMRQQGITVNPDALQAN